MAKKVYHKIVEKRDWGYIIFSILVVNIILSVLLFLLGWNVYQFMLPIADKETKVLLILVIGIISFVYLNYVNYKICDDYWIKTVEDEIK